MNTSRLQTYDFLKFAEKYNATFFPYKNSDNFNSVIVAPLDSNNKDASFLCYASSVQNRKTGDVPMVEITMLGDNVMDVSKDATISIKEFEDNYQVVGIEIRLNEGRFYDFEDVKTAFELYSERSYALEYIPLESRQISFDICWKNDFATVSFDMPNKAFTAKFGFIPIGIPQIVIGSDSSLTLSEYDNVNSLYDFSDKENPFTKAELSYFKETVSIMKELEDEIALDNMGFGNQELIQHLQGQLEATKQNYEKAVLDCLESSHALKADLEKKGVKVNTVKDSQKRSDVKEKTSNTLSRKDALHNKTKEH